MGILLELVAEVVTLNLDEAYHPVSGQGVVAEDDRQHFLLFPVHLCNFLGDLLFVGISRVADYLLRIVVVDAVGSCYQCIVLQIHHPFRLP